MSLPDTDSLAHSLINSLTKSHSRTNAHFSDTLRATNAIVFKTTDETKTIILDYDEVALLDNLSQRVHWNISSVGKSTCLVLRVLVLA